MVCCTILLHIQMQMHMAQVCSAASLDQCQTKGMSVCQILAYGTHCRCMKCGDSAFAEGCFSCVLMILLVVLAGKSEI